MKENILEKIKKLCSKDNKKLVTTRVETERIVKNADYPDFSSIKDGDQFGYCGYRWVRLCKESDGVLCVTKQPIGVMPFDNNGSNDWRQSSLREYLNSTFVAKLDKDALYHFRSDLIADNGDAAYGIASDYVGLLSCDLYRKYRNIIPRYENWVWTCTPWICRSTHSRNVRSVGPFGELGVYCAENANSVVPVCVFIDSR